MPTMVDWPILLALILGHVALFVLAVNLLHSTNTPEKVLDVLNLALLATMLAAMPWIVTQGHWTTWPALPRAYASACLAIALVGLPAVTALRHLRKAPDGVASRAEELDLAASHGLDRVVGEGRGNWMLRLPGNQSFRVHKVECEVTLPAMPRALDGLTLVQISDLHFSRCYRRDFFELVADEAARWDADLVAFTGDLLDDEATLDWVEPVLSRLRGKFGQFAILGNHDHRLRPGRARRALRRAGYADLDGRWARVDVDGSTLALGGTSEPWGPALNYAAMPADADLRLVLSHAPDQFPRARARGVDLVLAGHNHGGQIRLPVLGPLLMPSRYSRHFDRGFFRSGDALLYVSQGVGGKHPLRYGGCHPEITRFTLRALPNAYPHPLHRREQVDSGVARQL